MTHQGLELAGLLLRLLLLLLLVRVQQPCAVVAAAVWLLDPPVGMAGAVTIWCSGHAAACSNVHHHTAVAVAIEERERACTSRKTPPELHF